MDRRKSSTRGERQVSVVVRGAELAYPVEGIRRGFLSPNPGSAAYSMTLGLLNGTVLNLLALNYKVDLKTVPCGVIGYKMRLCREST